MGNRDAAAIQGQRTIKRLRRGSKDAACAAERCGDVIRAVEREGAVARDGERAGSRQVIGDLQRGSRGQCEVDTRIGDEWCSQCVCALRDADRRGVIPIVKREA